jgi:hypothetical protein
MEYHGSWIPIKMGWVYGQPDSAVHVRHTIGVVVWYATEGTGEPLAWRTYKHTTPTYIRYMMHVLEGLALSICMQMIWDGRLVEGHEKKM